MAFWNLRLACLCWPYSNMFASVISKQQLTDQKIVFILMTSTLTMKDIWILCTTIATTFDCSIENTSCDWMPFTNIILSKYYYCSVITTVIKKTIDNTFSAIIYYPNFTTFYNPTESIHLITRYNSILWFDHIDRCSCCLTCIYTESYSSLPFRMSIWIAAFCLISLPITLMGDVLVLMSVFALFIWEGIVMLHVVLKSLLLYRNSISSDWPTCNRRFT